MTITSNFEVRINDSGYVVFSHPHDEKEAYDNLEKAVNKDEFQTLFTNTYGSSSRTATPQSRQWIVNNYTGIKKVAEDYAEKFDFRIMSSVLENLN